MASKWQLSLRAFLSLEQLDARVVPATFVNTTTVTYQDVDGDLVTVRLSKPLLSAGNADNVFTFAPGKVNGDNSLKQQLQHIDLTSFAGSGNGAGITVTAKRTASGGDGLANVGRISGWDLGPVSIAGDLGAITAGDPDTKTTALASLTVQSMGRYGTTTGAPSLVSDVFGPLGTLTIKSDAVGVLIQAFGAGAADNAAGKIAKITIGGSLLAGAGTGSIVSSGDMGLVTIGGDVVGGAGASTGHIISGGKLAGVTISGSLLGGTFAAPDLSSATGAISSGAAMGAVSILGRVQGGTGTFSGRIDSATSIGPVTIGGSLSGNAAQSGSIFAKSNIGAVKIGGSILGGAGANSAEIFAQTGIVSLSVIGDIRGGTGSLSGLVFTPGSMTGVRLDGSLIGGDGGSSGKIEVDGALGPVRINGDVRGGNGGVSGRLLGTASLASVTIGGSLIGGAGGRSGTIQGGGAMGAVLIQGSIQGGSGVDSGEVNNPSGSIARATVGGALVGGSGTNSGYITAAGDLGPVKIVGDLRGGAGQSSGNLTAKKLASVTIGGSLVGGAGQQSGLLFASDIGNLNIVGDVRGGSATNSGRIFTPGGLASLTIGGSVFGAQKDGTGEIRSNGDMGLVTIGGDLVGGDAPTGGSIEGTGYIQARRIAGITIGGSVRAGTNNNADPATYFLKKSGTIRAVNDIGPIVVKGSLVGSRSAATGFVNPALITARGKPVQTTSDVAIASLAVFGRVERASTLAGYDVDLNPVNGDAQIGAVTVNGDWIASNLIAGVASANSTAFGTANDQLIPGSSANIVSKIASIKILGQALGTSSSINPADHFGFVAEQIGSFSVGGATIALQPGLRNDALVIGATEDLELREIIIV